MKSTTTAKMTAVCVVRPCDWEMDGHSDLAEWGKKVAAAKDSAMEKYGNPTLYGKEFPEPPAGYFGGEHGTYYLQQAAKAAWKYWGKYSG